VCDAPLVWLALGAWIMIEESLQATNLLDYWYKSFPLLKDVKSIAGKQLLARASLTKWSCGEQIINQLDPSEAVFFLISGTCRAVYFSYDGALVAFRVIKPGNYFGELGVLTDRRRVSSVTADSDVTTAQLTKADFQALLYEEPQMTLEVARSLAQTVQVLTSRVVEQTTLNVQQRIWAELVRMAQSSSQSTGQTQQIPMLTHEKLASIVGVNRETVTRELRSMRQSGLISYDRQHLRILGLDSIVSTEGLSNLFELTEIIV
jgi:CRP/FNR family transcriptional regulator, cyclic AMP receptor protein